MPLAVEIIGIGETHTTAQSWEDALANDIQHTGKLKAEAFSTVSFDGVVYTATEYPLLTSVAGAEHDGRAHEVSGAGNARIEHVGASSCFYIYDEFVRVSWLEIKGPGDNAFSGIYLTSVTASTCHIHHNIVHNNAANAGASHGITVFDADSAAYVYRNIVYGFGGRGFYAPAISATGVVLCNTVFKNAGGGFISGVADITIWNNVVVENTGDDFNPFGGPYTDADRNASSDGTANPTYGGNSINNVVTADQVINPTTTWALTDLTINAGADLIDAGTDFNPATYPEINVPISNRSATIIGTWDIGADELVSGAFFSSECEDLGDFDWTGASGGGSIQLVRTSDYDNFTVHQGTWALETEVAPVAGYAQARCDHPSGVGLGGTSHVGGYMMLVRTSADWPGVLGPTIPSGIVKLLEMQNQDSTLATDLRLTASDGANYGKKFQLHSTPGDVSSGESLDGLEVGVWDRFDFYTYVGDAPDGYTQLFIAGSKWIEKAGIDTYMGKAINRVTLGILFKGDSSSRVCALWDGATLIWDDEASPKPPGVGRVRRKIFGGLGGMLSRGGGLVSGP